MAFSFVRIAKGRPLVVLSAAVAIALTVMPRLSEAGEAIAVNVDQAKLFRIPGRVATLVVGNPMIADVALQPGGVVVVTGKGYGATNVIAMDRSGEVIEDRVIQVEGPTDDLVTVYRGTDRESYSCKPSCQRRVTLGDSEKYFKSAIDQAVSLSEHAGGTTGKAH